MIGVPDNNIMNFITANYEKSRKETRNKKKEKEKIERRERVGNKKLTEEERKKKDARSFSS